MAPAIGATDTARILGLSRASAYRRRGPKRTGGPACLVDPRPRPTPARALSVPEQAKVLEVLRSERFFDVAPLLLALRGARLPGTLTWPNSVSIHAWSVGVPGRPKWGAMAHRAMNSWVEPDVICGPLSDTASSRARAHGPVVVQRVAGYVSVAPIDGRAASASLTSSRTISPAGLTSRTTSHDSPAHIGA
jgi:hypothetical protein